MKIFAPSFYKDFKCLADKCGDSCCIGWEINIDREREVLYARLGGEIGEALRGAVAPSKDGACAHFILGDGGRCPLLTAEGLCRLICLGGEEMLTEICREHPRYYNLYSDIAEVGLGLSCEAAARLVLNSDLNGFLNRYETDTTAEHDPETPSVGALLPARDKLFELLCDRGRTAEETLAAIFSELGGRIPTPEEIRALLSELEGLDDGFLEAAAEGCEKAEREPESFAKFYADFDAAWGRKILASGIHRHFLDAALFGSGVGGGAVAAVLSLSVALYLFYSDPSLTEETAVRATVLASKNIEYSEYNVETVIDFGDSLLA